MRQYLSTADLLWMHKILIDRYGGAQGVRDLGALEAAVFRPQSGYYKDIIWEAAALMESLAINYPFLDGNKRIAFAAADTFLKINHYFLRVSSQVAFDFIDTLFKESCFRIDQLEGFLRIYSSIKH